MLVFSESKYREISLAVHEIHFLGFLELLRMIFSILEDYEASSIIISCSAGIKILVYTYLSARTHNR